MSTSVVLFAPGQIRGNQIEIAISNDAAERLFDEAFAGWCLACRNYRVDAGELVCCKCLSKAMRCHRKAGCCSEANGEQIPA